MVNSKNTKRALLTSALAILACVAMLIGTTFAWFTDTASTSVNKIVSGKLDVALEMKDDNGNWVSAEGKTLNFLQKQGDKLVQNADILWEPGATYQLPELRIVNNGNLALKYMVKVTGINGSAELLKVIDFTATKNGKTVDLNEWEGVLLPKGATVELAGAEIEETASIIIAGTMQTTAGNEYQDLTAEGIAITVYATQYTYEFDSNNNQYDAAAAYKGSQDFTSGTHTLDKGGVALNPNDVAVHISGEGTEVTITGGFYNGGEKGDNRCIQVDEGATVIIKDGTFTVGGDATGLGNSVVLCNGGTVIVEGGFFYTNYAYRNFYYVLNQQNGKPGTITVKGGTFVNYDPSKGDDNLHGNFVAEGYSVISETKANGDVWYTVVKGKAVANADELIAALQSDDDVVLANDITVATGVQTAKNRKQTLNFNGHKLILDGEDQWSYGCFDVYGELTLIDSVGNGGITGKFYHGPTKVPTAVFINDGAVVNLKGGTIENVYRGVANYYSGGTFNMTGGKIAVKQASEIESAGVLFRRGGTVNLTGGEISGAIYFEETAESHPNYTIGAGFTNTKNDVFNTSGVTALRNKDGIWTSTIQ